MWFAVNAKCVDIGREQRLAPRYAIATLIALLAAMLSKAPAVAVAPVITLLWIIFWHDNRRQDRLRTQLLWPVASLILATCFALVFASNSTIKEPGYMGIEVLIRALAILGWMARLSITPEGRHFFYPVLEDPHLYIMVTLGGVILAAAISGAVMLLRKKSLEGFSLIAFVLLCAPYMQLIPYRTLSFVSDRFIALGVWLVMLLIVSLAWRLSRLPRAVLLLVVALLCCGQTIERSNEWRSYEALVDVDFQAFPRLSIPAMYKADIQLSQGLVNEARATASNITVAEIRSSMVKLIKAHQAVAASGVSGDPVDAMSSLHDFELDLGTLPEKARWNTTLGGIWRINQNYLEFEWLNLLRYFPDNMLVRYNAGTFFLGIQKYESAIVHLNAAIESQRLPESQRGAAYRNFGVALLDSGYVPKAEAPLRKALDQSPPDWRAYCSLSELFKRTGRLEEAARAAAECSSHAPRDGAVQ
jgi:tetratricopeptide (TPR) repeat protein